MKQLLERLEKRLQTLVEGTIMMFPWGPTQKSVAISIINELRLKIISSSDLDEYLPNVFTVKLNPDIYKIISSDSKWILEVKQVLIDTASESGIHFAGPLSLELMPAVGFQQQQYELSASTIANEIEQTAIMKIAQENMSNLASKPKQGFLMLQNQELFKIDRGIIQIGRKKDNHLIINDPTISRNHAQIRFIQNNYVIFDLNSTGGTFVNNQQISQSALFPGDVIKLADYILIYGEEQTEQSDLQDQTTELPRTVDPT